MSSTTRVGAYLILCRLLQMVLDLTNNQFFLLFLVGAAVIFIISSLTHTHDMPAQEAAQQVEDKVDSVVNKLIGSNDEHVIKIKEISGPSGYKAPEGF